MRSAEDWAVQLSVGEAMPIPAEVIERIQRDAFRAGAEAALRRYEGDIMGFDGYDSDIRAAVIELEARARFTDGEKARD